MVSVSKLLNKQVVRTNSRRATTAGTVARAGTWTPRCGRLANPTTRTPTNIAFSSTTNKSWMIICVMKAWLASFVKLQFNYRYRVFYSLYFNFCVCFSCRQTKMITYICASKPQAECRTCDKALWGYFSLSVVKLFYITVIISHAHWWVKYMKLVMHCSANLTSPPLVVLFFGRVQGLSQTESPLSFVFNMSDYHIKIITKIYWI